MTGVIKNLPLVAISFGASPKRFVWEPYVTIIWTNQWRKFNFREVYINSYPPRAIFGVFLTINLIIVTELVNYGVCRRQGEDGNLQIDSLLLLRRRQACNLLVSINLT
jgi:hypothetical protein